MSIYLYLERNTLIHRLHPVTKMVVLILFFVLLLLFSKPLPLLIIGLFIFMVSLMAKSTGNIRRVWFLMVVLGISTVVLWTIFYPGKNLLERLNYGFAMALRLDLMIFAGIIFLSTTRIEEFTYGLTKIGVPFRVSFALTLAFRLVPSLIVSGKTTIEAQKSRGLDLESGNIFQRMRKFLPLVIPLLAMSLRNAEILAISLESKGFGARKKRTYFLNLESKKAG